MASAQVLPSSRKQEHLEAGKKRLEEFRKKKAAERAKKASPTNQPNASDVSLQEKHLLETERVRLTDSDGVGTSNGPVIQPPVVINNSDNNAIEPTHRSKHFSSNDINADYPFSSNGYNSFPTNLVQTHATDQEIIKFDDSGPSVPVSVSNSQETRDRNNNFGLYTGVQGRLPYGNTSANSIGLHSQASQDYESNSSQSSLHGMEEFQSKENNSFTKVSTFINPGLSHASVTEVSPQNFGSTLLQSKPSNSSALGSGLTFSLEDSIQPTTSIRGSALEVAQNMHGGAELSQPINYDLGERKLSSPASGLPSVNSVPVQTSVTSGFNFDVRSSANNVPLYSARNETSRRSRPSFLDSLNVPRASSETISQHTEPERPSSAMSPFEHFGNSSIYSSNGGDLPRPIISENTMERKYEFYSPKQNEDFAALEQHIEDLTQEKFSLQRALEASRALAESLAAENTSLTDSYNQQRSVVNQLKSDMEELQEEIKAQLAELESFKIEYANARLECNAADERANILASEVIALEEKALRLRSSELKLERRLENSQAEISSYKKKISSLERERQDLQSTIDAFQEEKKLLQSKLRKASTGGKSIDDSKSSTGRKDMSTSTEDLENQDSIPDASSQEMLNNTSLLGSDASSLPLLPEIGQLTQEVSSLNIPPDQMRMVQNINALLSELALEKEELNQALSSELSQSSKLKELNKELSRKLEAQTQRLELLTAQNMANENISARQPDSRTMHENTTYADEGDEVVERVLGWIMKLFPGGPSRRRTSKLL